MADRIDATFDVFLSHNTADKPVVERIANRLRDAGLKPWLDSWYLVPGDPWQEELQQALQRSRCCAAFIGPNGVGAWANEEIDFAIDRAAHDRSFRVFSVLLPGLPEPFDPAILRIGLTNRTWVDLRDWPLIPHRFDDLANAILGVSRRFASEGDSQAEICPYRGLEVFDEAHAEFFFGREAETQRVIEKLKEARLVGVSGPSGSGKSSLVRAGVVPALRAGALPASDSWIIRLLRPGGHPLAALASSLVHASPELSLERTVDELRSSDHSLHLITELILRDQAADARLFLVVDQLEELFTIAAVEEERRQFLANLVYAAKIPNGRLAAIVTLRADFYHRLAAYQEFAAHVASRQFLVSPMGQEALQRAIEEPLHRVGLRFEDGLVETLLDAVGGQLAPLPLLEHVLLELWERRRGGVLTLVGYQASGGLEGALATRAESIYEGFDERQRAVARRSLLRLTQPGQGTEDTRRRATLSELMMQGDGENIAHVIAKLADARLVTTSRDEQSGAPVVEVAHEALIRGWRRLRGWIDENREGLLLHRRLTDAAQDWEERRRDPDRLYRGGQLAQTLDWRHENESLLNELEREFLDASAAAHRDQLEAAKRTTRRMRSLAAALTALLAFAGVAGVYALSQRNSARASTRVALSRALAGAAERDAFLDRALLLSLEGCRLACGAATKTALLSALDRTWYLKEYVRPHRGPVEAVALSSDGKTLASGNADGTVTILATSSGRAVRVLRSPRGRITGVAFSPDGRELASSGSDDGTLTLWAVASGRRLHVFHGSSFGRVLGVAFSPDGKTLAAGGEDTTVTLWDVATDKLRKVLRGHSSAVWSVAFTPDGKMLASGSRDMTVALWRVSSGRRIRVLRGHGGSVLSVATSRNGLLGSASDDGTVAIWSLASGKRVRVLRGNGRAVEGVAFTPDDKILAAGNSDGSIDLWVVATGKRLRVLRGHASYVYGVAFSRDGQTLVSGSYDKTIALWAVASSRRLRVLGSRARDIPGSTVYSVAFSPNGRTLASGDVDGSVALWDVRAGMRLRRFGRSTPGDVVYCVAFSPDGKIVAAGTNGTTTLWSAASGERARVLQSSGPVVLGVAFSPDGRMLASALDDATIALWDVRSGRRLRVLHGHTKSVDGVAFSPDGQTLASASSDATAALWDVASGRRLHVLRLPGSFVDSVAFSPDGKTVATGSADNRVALWATSTGKRLRLLLGHSDSVYSVAFSPHGETLVSGSADGTIALWETPTGRLIGKLVSPAITRTVAVSRDGRLVSGADDGRIRLWSALLPIEHVSPLHSYFCGIVRRNLTREEWAEFLPGQPYHRTCSRFPVGT